MAWSDDILYWARNNTFFREVLSTGPHTQVVVMSIPPGADIGEEVHPHTDQVLVVVQGRGEAMLDQERTPVGPGSLVHVPEGTLHDLVNTGGEDLRLYTVYSPPAHAPGTIHLTKAEAEAAELVERDRTPVPVA